MALSTIMLGALGYCMNDSQFAMNGLAAYKWVGLYFALICCEMTYGKVGSTVQRLVFA